MPQHLKVGDRYGRFTVLCAAPWNGGQTKSICQCDCGEIRTVYNNSLKRGEHNSCGCSRIIHGHNDKRGPSITYLAWIEMRRRCLDSTRQHFKNYGGRGICVCERWSKFENFLTDMGCCPEGLSLDRINNNQGYFKENCRWASDKVQSNNKRNNRFISFMGKRQTLAQWADEIGISNTGLSCRLSAGWTISDALQTPVRKSAPRTTA